MSTSRECDLCGLECGRYPVEQRVGGAERVFCCAGCMNVYLILSESGAIRPGQDLRDTELFKRSLQLGLVSNRPQQETNPAATPTSPPGEELLLHISGMWCTSCAWLIEHALKSLPGLSLAEVSFASDVVKVCYQPHLLPPDRIMQRIESLGYRAQRQSADTEAFDAERRDLLIRTGLAAFLWVNVMSFSLVLYAGYFEQISGSVRRGLPFLLMAMATPVVFYCAQPVLRLAWRGLCNGTIRMEALLALGILAAYGYSIGQAIRGDIHLYFDTATVIVTLVLAGKLIERSAKEKVSRWITSLHRTMPNKVRLLSRGLERFVSIAALEPGQVFVVKAGEQMPADGLVVEGESHADESLLTGESVPVTKRAGDRTVAGSINLDGVLHVEATKSADNSTLSRIIAQVEHALSSRCDLERTVDRISRIFVPSVVLIACATFLGTWMAGAATFGQALMRGITVLVIACPCALGLATPLTITAAFGAASRRGILVRDSRVLETMGKIDTVIVDKTGTLTAGTFSLVDLVCCKQCPAEAVLAGPLELEYSDRGGRRDSDRHQATRETLSLLASLEQYSQHPLGQAVSESALREGVKVHEASSLKIHKGSGISGIVSGRVVFAGNRRLIAELGLRIDSTTESQAKRWETEGKTVSFAGWDGELRALAAFGDRVKPDAVELVRELKCRDIKVRLISGDAYTTTSQIASCVGIDSFEAESLPDHKANAVRRLQETGSVVAMIGDGINDAPALAQSDLGIAIASGTDIAMKAAAVILMNGCLLKTLEILDLSHTTMRVVRQNLFWAFFYNGIGISLAVAGILNPIMAAAAMLLSSLSVIANSLRLVRNLS